MRKLFAAVVLLSALPIAASDDAVPALQSGSRNGPRSIHEAGILGQGEVVAVLDTGLDWDNCYLAETDGSAPPVNTVNPDGTLETVNVDHSRRKVVAYDFLYSCEEYPTAAGCDAAALPGAWDNQGHGTRAAGAIAGDHGAPLAHDYGDAIAPGAKLVIQDAGFIGGDDCSHRPGLRCPVRDLYEVLEQAYEQGARIHSNSWGDRQGAGMDEIPPTANYTDTAAQIDRFVHEHPDMLVVYNAGNAGIRGMSSISSPGVAKNTIQVAGFDWHEDEGAVLYWSGSGPTRDGRLKPELIAPAFVLAADSDLDVTTGNCGRSVQGGTSWSGPLVAGAAALVRQYYREGHAPTNESGFNPSSALVKATLVASARLLRYYDDGGQIVPIPNEPSFQQGFGMPVLDDVLSFPGDPETLWMRDIDRLSLTESETVTFRFDVHAGQRFRVVLAWIDPPAAGSEAAEDVPRLVNDLNLRIVAPDGTVYSGNQALGAVPDRVNNLEEVHLEEPVSGRYTVVVDAHAIRHGTSQAAALVVSGDLSPASERRRSIRRR